MSNDMGKGLNSLLSDSNSVVSQKLTSFRGVKEVLVNKIKVNPHQPRTDFDETALNELADSIKIHGIIQPLTVRESKDGSYELISGERRLRAIKIVGLQKVPAYIRNVDDQRSLEMALIENIQRQNLNAIEVALSFERMIKECSLKQEELGGRVGKNRTTVNNYLRLLQLPAAIQSGIVLGQLTMGQARPLITLEDEAFQLELFQKIVQQGLSARKVEELVKQENAFGEGLSPLEGFREDMRIEEISLKGHTIVPLKIKVNAVDKGEISLPFDNEEQLAQIVETLGLA
ncbi:ParB/RepB/Spo0J family partition protein [Arcticibacterium luteifluviistationis]|uniref:Chromosome partitioning protein ParB n=1 Tax=Arcticibacterium luteifluviistationis TaxID=1784714 RepID=A0A2Z4G9P5_9BACT|nr:ParB/RepB/Spo0J family partition protein [Arcticibacterium luteifluviistationis]AWV97931.1 chromosome partitioning protein ParB [Arcticibacterium luteifluviistationis]